MLIELINLKKSFTVKGETGRGSPQRVRAVDGVSLCIREGENLGLVGESGSGKTTLSRLILRLTQADSGQILFAGRDLLNLSGAQLRPLRRNLQMVFQDPYGSLDPRYTVEGILKEALGLLRERTPRPQQDQQIEDILNSVGLSADVRDRFPHEFSGGERQRIAIARALIMNPRLLILDEAVSSLDVLIQEQIIDLLRDLQTRFPVTYLFITHNLRVVRKLCPRLAVMYRGKIVELAPTEALFRNPLHPYTRQLLSAALDYRASWAVDEMSIPENSQLVDRGDGHFVIN